MPRLVVVLPLSPLGVGDSFAMQDWPLHITVVPPFLTNAFPEKITAAIASATSGQPALTVIAGEDRMFGRREDVPVTVVADNDALHHLHRTLLDAVRPFAASPEESTFTGQGFRPHVTIKSHRRAYEGDELILTQLALVDMAPRSAESGRSVLSTIEMPSEK